MPEDFDELLTNKTTLQVGDRTVTLDPGRLVFNEDNLSTYIEREAVFYDHFGNILAEAEEILANAEAAYDSAYAGKYAKRKEEEGGSDPLVKAFVESDAEVGKLKRDAIAAKRVVRLLQNHLRSFDKCHENAQSRGHTLRKEMDKIGGDIYHGGGRGRQYRQDDSVDPDLEQLVAARPVGGR